MSERMTLPVLPLRDLVLFPGVTAPINAGRPGTLRAVERALKDERRLIFTVAQRENNDHVAPANLYTMGTVAKIGQIDVTARDIANATSFIDIEMSGGLMAQDSLELFGDKK